MRLLYHLWLSPLSRKIRVVLKEKNLDFTMKVEKTWERRPEFLALNPAGEVPVLIEPDGTVLAEANAIAEFLDEVYRDKLLIGINALDRAEVRRLTHWFDGKLNREVTEPLVGEKMMKRFLGLGEPNSSAIRICAAGFSGCANKNRPCATPPAELTWFASAVCSRTLSLMATPSSRT